MKIIAITVTADLDQCRTCFHLGDGSTLTVRGEFEYQCQDYVGGELVEVGGSGWLFTYQDVARWKVAIADAQAAHQMSPGILDPNSGVGSGEVIPPHLVVTEGA